MWPVLNSYAQRLGRPSPQAPTLHTGLSLPSETGPGKNALLWLQTPVHEFTCCTLSPKFCNPLGEGFLIGNNRREGAQRIRMAICTDLSQPAQQSASPHSVSPCFCWFPCEYHHLSSQAYPPSVLFDDQHLCLSRVTASLTSSLPGPFFSLPFLPSPSFGQTVPFVQGASGLDGRPGPPVSVTSPLPFTPPHPTPSL